ncbi:hypothetical protein D3C71_1684540 [compost metagenome]
MSRGTKIRKMEMPSRNMPTVISIRIRSAITPHSPRPELTMAVVIGSITPSVESEKAKIPASDTTIRMTADSSPASRRMGNRSRTPMVRWITMPTNRP